MSEKQNESPESIPGIQEIPAASSGPSSEDIRETLKAVKDPELMLDIVNLGLVYEVKLNQDRTVDVDMTLTSPGCPMGPQILGDVHRAITQQYPEIKDVNVNLVWAPFWNPDMMSEEAKDELGFF
ncbi:MAG: metal-sulfur cluster assembly factor [Chloroflexi bacterium]|nr:metal-sulfur cluster assembly factor [Chloroflexota bacterium]